VNKEIGAKFDFLDGALITTAAVGTQRTNGIAPGAGTSCGRMTKSLAMNALQLPVGAAIRSALTPRHSMTA
jgi:outer membrane receptor protein involved in Fe transport